MIETFVIFVVVAVGIVVVVVVAAVKDAGTKRTIKSALEPGEGFSPSESFASVRTGIAVDIGRNIVRLVRFGPTSPIVQDFQPSEIIELQIHDSGTVIAQSGSVGLGGLAGGVGLGYLTGSKSKISVHVSLWIFLTDVAEPTWMIPFGALSDVKAEMGEQLRQVYLSQAKHWYGLLTAMSHLEERATQDSSDSAQAVDVATRLQSLADLHQRGLIDRDEYRAAKSQLLGIDTTNSD